MKDIVTRVELFPISVLNLDNRDDHYANSGFEGSLFMGCKVDIASELPIIGLYGKTQEFAAGLDEKGRFYISPPTEYSRIKGGIYKDSLAVLQYLNSNDLIPEDRALEFGRLEESIREKLSLKEN